MAEDESVLTRDVSPPDSVLTYGPEAIQTVEIRRGREGAARPLLIFIHGGFWRPDIDRTHAGPLANALAAAGWSIAVPEYSRVPGDPERTFEDMARILTQAIGWPVPHNGQLILMGHSAGGHLALWAAAACPSARLIGTLALAPVSDLALAHDLGLGDGAVSRFLGGDPSGYKNADPARMPTAPADVTLVHGAEDVWVPLQVSESYVAAHPSARLVIVPGAGHFALIDPLQSPWITVTAQLARWLP